MVKTLGEGGELELVHNLIDRTNNPANQQDPKLLLVTQMRLFRMQIR
jgi:hypothetical protein